MTPTSYLFVAYLAVSLLFAAAGVYYKHREDDEVSVRIAAAWLLVSLFWAPLFAAGLGLYLAGLVAHWRPR